MTTRNLSRERNDKLSCLEEAHSVLCVINLKEREDQWIKIRSRRHPYPVLWIQTLVPRYFSGARGETRFSQDPSLIPHAHPAIPWGREGQVQWNDYGILSSISCSWFENEDHTANFVVHIPSRLNSSCELFEKPSSRLKLRCYGKQDWSAQYLVLPQPDKNTAIHHQKWR